ncbi:MAG: endonuclease/exonuclease/phosphatase family protein [Myxococcales bacterium]|nr:endonuclease/exonuclease/phosphatase family protein [Myxococcales bacterium]
MRRIAALLLPLSLAVAGCPGTEQDFSTPKKDAEPGPPDAAVDVAPGPPVPVRVMNWNVKNLFNDKRDSLEIKQADETIVPAGEYQAKLDAIAGVIAGEKPDVVILQEVENMAVVNDLGAKLGGYPHRAITQGNDPRGIDIAVLSELPMEIGPSHKGEFFKASSDTGQFFKFARDVLEVHLTVNTRHFALLGIHFKAEDGDPTSAIKRVAEAERTRKIATGIQFGDPAVAIVVLGDFNSTPGSPPLDALAGNPSTFTSSTAAMPAADRYSVTFGGSPQLYDDQLGDPAAATLLDAASVTILHDGAVNTASDHDPVLATYMLH